jgi:hypothetical protein
MPLRIYVSRMQTEVDANGFLLYEGMHNADNEAHM